MNADVSQVSNALELQLKIVLGVHRKWTNYVSKSDEAFTSLAYNLIREQGVLNSGFSDENAWPLKSLYECSTASSAFLLDNDIHTAAKMTAAHLIEDAYDQLDALLNSINGCLSDFEKTASRLDVLYQNEARFHLHNTVRDCAGDQKTKKKIKGKQKPPLSELVGLIFWPALVGEAKALESRLRADLSLRRGLLSYVAQCVTDASFGDFGAPQRLCFLWRQSHVAVKWVNLLEMIEELREIYT